MARVPLISDALVRRLLRDPKAAQAFWFLKTPPTTSARGVVCCNRKPPEPQPDLNAIKRLIAGLPAAGRTKLLAALGLSAARVIYEDRGKVVEVPLGG